MPRCEKVSIDVGDLTVERPEGGRVRLADLGGVQVLILLRHRHCLPCHRHLVEVQNAAGEHLPAGLVAIGFSPAERSAAIARHLGWRGGVLSDPSRQLYRRLGIGRAPWWRIYNRGTLALYGRAILKGEHLARPVEDTRQLGGDAVMVDGTVTTLWRSVSPDDRPPPHEVVAAACVAAEGRE